MEIEFVKTLVKTFVRAKDLNRKNESIIWKSQVITLNVKRMSLQS